MSLKKLGLLIVMLATIFTSYPSFAKAEDFGTLDTGDGYTYWKIESSQKNYTTEAVGSWVLAYAGTPAKRDGEYDTVSASITRGASVSGSIQVSKGAIAGEVGVSLSKDYTVGGSKNSAPLKKGEYIKGYVKQVATVSKVIQRQWTRIDKTNIKGSTATAYVKKPTGVTIRIDYYKNGYETTDYKINNLEVPYKSEYFYLDTETQELIELNLEDIKSKGIVSEDNLEEDLTLKLN